MFPRVGEQLGVRPHLEVAVAAAERDRTRNHRQLAHRAAPGNAIASATATGTRLALLEDLPDGVPTIASEGITEAETPDRRTD